MNDPEHKEMMDSFEIVEIPALGYGNPEASISYRKQKESGELPDGVEVFMVEAVVSGNCMVEVTDKDDGCIDGRTAIKVTYIDAEGATREVEIDDDGSHTRGKVAGGGYLTALAMELAFHPPEAGIDETLRAVATDLAEQGIFCGAHSGDHQDKTGGSTDGGANDKVSLIYGNGVKYADKIADTLTDLMDVAGLTFDNDRQATVLSNWSDTVIDSKSFDGSTGQSRYEVILDVLASAQTTVTDQPDKPLAVTKHLRGNHKEDFIVINLHAGTTFSQAKLRAMVHEQFSDLPEHMIPQAFVVDVWRIVELATAVADKKEQDDAFEIALQAGLSYQLATAATLTDGTLRTFVVK